MPDITQYNPLPLAGLMTNIRRYRFNPSAIQRVILDHLSAVTDGVVDIVDPTNPFVFLLEASSVNTAVAIQEAELNLRKQYPILADTDQDLYLHMSDKDYANRFATPSVTTFKFMIQLSSLLAALVDSPEDKAHKVTLPRNTEFTIDGYTFSLQYPIQILKHYSGVLEIRYDASQVSPLQTLSTNIIDYVIRKDSNNVDWVYFSVTAYQFKITTSYYPVQVSQVFEYTFPYTDHYYFARVWYRSTANPTRWIEIYTTHTDQVYDPYKPTAVLKVGESTLTVYIPPVYLYTGALDGNIRIDVYTTKGDLVLNLSNYALTAFTTTLRAIDETNDIDRYTNAMGDVTYLAYSDQIVTGGSQPLSFMALRDAVIYQGLGHYQLPITNLQFGYHAASKGFDIVRNVDVLTNRIFLATRGLPTPDDSRLITPANTTIETLLTTLEQLALLPTVRDNYHRLTLLPTTVYQFNNGQLTIYPDERVTQLLQRIPADVSEQVNTQNYLYTPFYYVLDNSLTEFEIRAYHLDHPLIDQLSFVEQNATLQLPVNTGSYSIEKRPDGYRVYVVTKSGNYYKQLADSYVNAQLAFLPTGESSLAYIDGSLLSKTPEGERIWYFDIETRYDLDANDQLQITNTRMFNDEVITTPANLVQLFYIFHTTTSITPDYVPSTIDSHIGLFRLPANTAAITEESVQITFGYALKHLWTRSRSSASGLDYQTYESDVPMTYMEDIYKIQDGTGSIFTFDESGNPVYEILHMQGDIVRDDQGEIVYLHRKGDVILDTHGTPVLSSGLKTLRSIDLLLIDGRYRFATDTTYIQYRASIADLMTSWIVTNLEAMTSVLLEQTKIYYYPKRTLGLLSVLTYDQQVITLPAQQYFTVQLFVRNAVYRNVALRADLTRLTIATLNTSIQTRQINVSDLVQAIKAALAESITTVRVLGLGGDLNLETLTILQDEGKLSLRKKLLAQENGSLIVQEDIDVQFYDVELLTA